MAVQRYKALQPYFHDSTVRHRCSRLPGTLFVLYEALGMSVGVESGGGVGGCPRSLPMTSMRRL